MTKVSRRSLFGAALGGAVPAAPPNLLFIVTDSWRGQALPFAGDPNLAVPNLARLAREGAWCSRAYTTYAVCCPSRAAMLTGRFPHAAGVRRNHTLLPLDQATMSAALRSHGYRTGYIGKWHLDGGGHPGFVPPERRRGFDYWAAYNVAHQHFDGVYFRNDPTPIRTTGFEADYQTDLAIDFVRQKSRQPFFLYLSLVAPHSPHTPPERYGRHRPAELRLRPNVPERTEAAARKDLAGYYGLCEAVDSNLGRLFQAIDDLGLTGGTIVVFTSDHGDMHGSLGLEGFDSPFEESTRIPLLIRYPRRIKPGIEEKMLVSNVDYVPTLLSLCGARLPKGMQGVNLAGALTGGRRPSARSIYAEGALGEKDEWRMIVRDQDKLVVASDMRPTHLYDLAADPYELSNLVDQPAARRKRDVLLPMLQRWRNRTGD
jgi:arylsulfatase A-like enzyme